MTKSSLTNNENSTHLPSPLMGEGEGGGEHGEIPLTPALSHQGRGG